MEIIVLRVDNFIFCLYILKKKNIDNYYIVNG